MANNFRISDQYLNTMKAISDRPDLYDRTGAAYMPTLSRDDLSKLQAAEDGMAKILGSTYFSDGKKLQSRLDYLAKNSIFILENDIDQVLDYALDLRNFHKFSQDRIIVPILIATNSNKVSTVIKPC